jgi:NAD(P)-dependent dehydrogenase (short-subunit alcohol dehydrogenase family)
MGTPYRQTADGFELQMATNHLGHFALTGLLLDPLVASGRARVVTVSSVVHRIGHIDFDDVAGLQIRNTWAHYGNSKLANLLFTAELSRRLQAAGEPVMAVAAHPGWTRSNLIGNGAALGHNRLRARVGSRFGTLLGQSAAAGAGPSLYAATSPAVQPGQFIGPSHVMQLFGPPKVVRPSRHARNLADAARLWEASETLTGVHYRFPAPV